MPSHPPRHLARRQSCDDGSTIATKDAQRYKTTGLDESEDESWDENIGEDDETEIEVEEESIAHTMEVDDNDEVERLREELERWKSIATGTFQATSRDSNERGGKASAGSTKKKRSNDGNSVAGSKASCHSTSTRGTTNTEARPRTGMTKGGQRKKSKCCHVDEACVPGTCIPVPVHD